MVKYLVPSGLWISSEKMFLVELSTWVYKIIQKSHSIFILVTLDWKAMTFTHALKNIIWKDQKRREVLFLSELFSFIFESNHLLCWWNERNTMEILEFWSEFWNWPIKGAFYGFLSIPFMFSLWRDSSAVVSPNNAKIDMVLPYSII